MYWKLLLLVVVLIATVDHGLTIATPNTDAPQPDDEHDELYVQYSAVLADELNYIAVAWITPENETVTLPGPEKINALFKSRDDIQIGKLSNQSVQVWQRLARENNVTVSQLLVMLRFSLGLREHQTAHPNETESSNKTTDLLTEACDAYSPIPVVIATTTTENPNSKGALDIFVGVFLRPIAYGSVLLHIASMYVNATTTAEKLDVFDKLCITLHDLGLSHDENTMTTKGPQENNNKLYDEYADVLATELNFIPIAFATATPENKTIDLPGPEKLNKLFKSRDDINVSKLSTESGEIWDRVAYQNNVTTDRLFAMLRLSKDLRDYQSLHPNELESESSNKTFELITVACDTFHQVDAKSISTTTVKPTENFNAATDFFMKAFLRPLALGGALAYFAFQYSNGTTTAEKLQIFDQLCAVWQELRSGA